MVFSSLNQSSYLNKRIKYVKKTLAPHFSLSVYCSTVQYHYNMAHSSFLHVIENNKCIAVVQNSNYAVEGNILVCMSCCLNEPKHNFSRFVYHTLFFFW